MHFFSFYMLFKVPLTTSDIEIKIAYIFNLTCFIKSFWVNRHTQQKKRHPIDLPKFQMAAWCTHVFGFKTWFLRNNITNNYVIHSILVPNNLFRKGLWDFNEYSLWNSEELVPRKSSDFVAIFVTFLAEISVTHQALIC